MRRPSRSQVAAGLGAVLVIGAAGYAGLVAASVAGLPAVDGRVAVPLALLVGLAATVWRLRAGRGWARDGADEREPVAPDRPERSTVEAPVAGRSLADLQERAGREAREGEAVEDGIEVVRPALSEALSAALVGGGDSLATVRAAIEEGTWTDDREAAAVLSASVEPPARPFRHRVWAWLYPERVVRARVARAVQAVAEAADDALPAVPGQTAPRTIPVTWTSVDRLREHVDEPARPAIDPDAVDRGPSAPASQTPPAEEVGEE